MRGVPNDRSLLKNCRGEWISEMSWAGEEAATQFAIRMVRGMLRMMGAQREGASQEGVGNASYRRRSTVVLGCIGFYF